MDFKINNKYWLKRFVQDFIHSDESFLKSYNISVYDIETFTNRYKFRNNYGEKDKNAFKHLVNKYRSISTDCILHIKQNKLKYDIMRKFYDYVKSKDPDNKFDLNKIKFELLDVTIESCNDDKRDYMIVCDIDKSINFELIYGTLKVINEI